MKREVTDPNDNVIGRRCAVYFEMGPCFFRGGESVKSGGGYFLGKVVDRRGKTKLTVRFDDSQESDYVHKEVRFIEPSSKHPNQLVLCDDSEKTIATLEPVNVVAGDIVLANYDGEKWFRGRVAFVNTSKNTCDVAYDDGEYQTGVNTQKHIILISKGVDNPAWLAGLPVHVASSSGPAKKGTISETIENLARITVTYEDKKTKALSYVSIVLAIFLSVRMQPDREILSWPAPRTVVTSAVPKTKEKPRVLATQPVGTQKKEDNATTKTKTKPTAKPSQDKVETKRSSRTSPSRRGAHPNSRASRGSLNNVSYADCDSDIDADETDLLEYNLPTKSSGVGAKSKATRKELITVHDSDSEDENFVSAPVAKSNRITAAAKKTNATGKSLIDVESDSENDIAVVASSVSNKTLDANKKRKAPPRRKDAKSELDDDTHVHAKKRKTPSESRVSRNGAAKSYCEDDLGESDLEEAEETGERKGQASRGSSSRKTSQNDSVAVDGKKTIGSKSIGRTPQRRNPAIKIGPCQEPTYYDIATDVVEMGDSESEVYLSSLDSSESFVGKCFLTLTCMFHRRVPSTYHCKRLIDLLTFGPGNTSTSVVPDHTRMENAMKAFRLLVVQQGLADHIATGLDSEYVERAMNQVSAPYYTIAGDERRCTTASLQRLGLSVHALACGMEVFEILLKHQLRGCLGVTHPDDQYRSRPLVKQIMEYPRQRTKGVLKQMAKEYVQFWCRYSHFITGSFRCPPEESNPELLEESFDFVRSQASRVATSMGRALSYMCCLYSADSSTRMESVGFEVGLIMKEEVDSNNFETNDMVSDQAQNIRLKGKVDINFETNDMVSDQAQNIRLKGKVDMIVHLDETLIPDVLPKLAEALEVVDSFNTIYNLLVI